MTKDFGFFSCANAVFSDERLLLTGSDRMCTHTVVVYLFIFYKKMATEDFRFFTLRLIASCGTLVVIHAVNDRLEQSQQL